jgi:hypothetical protein
MLASAKTLKSASIKSASMRVSCGAFRNHELREKPLEAAGSLPIPRVLISYGWLFNALLVFLLQMAQGS